MTSEDFFEAAFHLLVESGAEAVTVTNLCARLDVTKGSFYYHFLTIGDFVDAFVQYWEAGVQELLLEKASVEDPYARIAAVLTALVNLPHEAEAALRAWGHTNPGIMAVHMRIYAAGKSIVAATMSEILGESSDAELFAHQAVAMSIGLQHLESPVDRRRYAEALARFVELIFPVTTTVSEGPDGLVVEVSARGAA